jgi:hypothetical protein
MIRFTDNPLDLPIGGPAREGAGPLYDPISAITSGIGLVGSLIGGAIGSNAATSGAKLINTADTTAANNTLATTAAVNPTLLAAGQKAGTDAINTAAGAGTDAINTATAAGTGVTGAAEGAAYGVDTATTAANTLLNPYATAGATASDTLNKGVGAGGQFDTAPTLSQLQMDPGYAFRLQQGQTSLDRSAAARGGVLSGGNDKAQTDFAQGSASQEYQSAFNRYETANQNSYNNLLGVSNAGQAAVGTQGANLINASTYGGNVNLGAAQYSGTANINASQYAGNADINASQYAGTTNVNQTNLTGANTIAAGNTANNYNVAGATATAQGKMGAANAWTGALNGIGNAASYGGMFGNPAAGFSMPSWSSPFSSGPGVGLPTGPAPTGNYMNSSGQMVVTH